MIDTSVDEESPEYAISQELQKQQATKEEEERRVAALYAEWLTHPYTIEAGKPVGAALVHAMAQLRALALRSSDPEVAKAAVHLDHCEENARMYGRI